MRALIIADEASANWLTGDGLRSGTDFLQTKTLETVPSGQPFDVVIDLFFENEAARLHRLRSFQSAVIIVNSVLHTLEETDARFVRINGWPGFLNKGKIEASVLDDDVKQKSQAFFSRLNREVEWLPDTPGFVTPRVISAIINEAFLALGEGVSTKEDIDTAMKLGTNYPYGPFEWAGIIGLKNIHALLLRLSQADPRYAPAPPLLSLL